MTQINGKKFVLLSDVEESDVPWLWRGWIPMGATTLIEGTTGTSKSTWVSDIAARVTSSALMPDGTFCEAPGGVVWVAYEENASYRLAPRLRLQGGDKTRVIDLSRIGDIPFDVALDEHIERLIDAVIACEATLVVIDPLLGMSTKKRVAHYQASYELMARLNGVAETLGVAIVIVNHTGRNQKAGLQSGAGSQGFTNNARSKITITKSETEPENVIAHLAKHSNSAEMPDVVFKAEYGWKITYIEGLTPEQEKVNQTYIAETNEKKLLTILEAQPDTPFSPETLTKRMYPVKYDTVKSLLKRMAERGEIAKVDRGQYQSMKGALVQI